MCRVHLIPSSILFMVGRAKSEAKKEREGAEEKAELQRIAVERYRQELQKGDGTIMPQSSDMQMEVSQWLSSMPKNVCF